MWFCVMKHFLFLWFVIYGIFLDCVFSREVPFGKRLAESDALG